jgi:peptidoglycan/xylan/chitin deacetylase (PgdA/CDA1 family)
MIPPLLTRIKRRIARHLPTNPLRMRNSVPLVSFTFDDVPDSAYLNGAALLDEYGMRGTFYIASGTCGTRDTYWQVIGRDQVHDLHQRGHEIGCHTFSHRAVDDLDAHQLNDECRRNFENLRDLCPDIQISNFCYPFGCVSLPRKIQLQKRFDTCRSIFEGVNSGVIDLSLLKVIELYDRTLSPEKLNHVLRRARQTTAWIIFYAHDVSERPTHMGCSPGLLRTTIEEIRKQDISCRTVAESLPLIGHSPRTPATAKNANDGSLALQ